MTENEGRLSAHGPDDSSGPRRHLPVVAVMLLLLIGIGLVVGLWIGTTNPEGESRHAAERASLSAPISPLEGDEIRSVDTLSLAAIVGDRPKTQEEKLAELALPEADDWGTEKISQAASAQMHRLAELIKNPQQIDPEPIASLVGDGFRCPRLRPAELTEVFRDRVTTVRRSQPGRSANPDEYRGPEGLIDALRHLVEPLREGKDIRAKFKIFRIEQDEDEKVFTTRMFLEASQRAARSGLHINAIWQCRWTLPDQRNSSPPRLEWIGLKQYEEVEMTAGATMFTDCTESVMGANSSYVEHVRYGIDHWLTRISRLQISFLGHHGMAMGDVNGDGLDDIYVCDTGGLPNRLYVQNPDGTVTDTSAQAGVDWLDHTFAALIIDLDNDDDQDLVVSTKRQLLLVENDGTGKFTLRAKHLSNGGWGGLCAADYDLDGDLDLYICVYNPGLGTSQLAQPVPYHDANNGGANALYRNDGQFRFVEVTEQAGLLANNHRFSLAAAWGDYDSDGDQDLYVANDFGRNNLYHNDDGHFTDVAPQAGVEDIAAGMSVSWADYNRDGHLDIYVSNMFSAAGNRVAYQRRYSQDRPDQLVAAVQRLARGNTMFANAGDGTFRDMSVEAAVTMGRWAWASRFADLNNDGNQDLVVANGFITAKETDDL